MRALLLLPLIAAVATPSAAEVVRQEDGPLIGAYTVGDWSGRCRRDGWLGGADHESCGAYLEGPLGVELIRTVKGLTINVKAEGCKRGKVSAKMSPKALEATDRVAQLEKAITNGATKLGKQCKPKPAFAHPVLTADLADILTETDGLEF